MSPDMTRRAALATIAGGVVGATATAGAATAQALPTNPDVVVIGAGAAGLAAAHELQAQGKSVVVVEAASRMGGRAWTESETFGVPYDQGAAWINASNINPFTRIAREGGFDLVDYTNAGSAFYVDGKRATAAQSAAYGRAWSAVGDALAEAGEAGQDIAASEVMPKGMKYSGTVKSWIGPMDWGVDMSDLSTADYWNSGESQPSFMVREGLGAVVEYYGQDAPVVLNAPVSEIDWSGTGVRVTTSQGVISAKAAIVTVSTGVLASGAIRFTPALPITTQEAVDGLPMGLLMKIALQFDGAKLGLADNSWLDYAVPEEMPAKASFFVTWPFGGDISVGFAGGKFGWELSAEGPEEAVDFALGELVKIAGSDARKHFVKGTMSNWADNPLTLGAYAAARPGQYGARAALEAPLGDKVWFAGEALGADYTGLVSGAYFSGKSMAQRLVEAGAAE